MENVPIKTWGLEKITLSPTYFNSLRLKYALEALLPVSGRVLEVGSGAGAFVRAIKDYRPDLEIVGSEIDISSVRRARKLDKEGKYDKADVHNLPYKDNSLDAVLVFDVIEHLESPQKALNEIKRVLKHGGIVHAAIPLEANLVTVHGLFLLFGVKPKEIFADHIKRFNLRDVKEIFNQAGLSSVSFCYSGHYFYQLIDFSYFSFLSLLGRPLPHTVEGYIETLPRGYRKSSLSIIRAFLSTLCYLESSIMGRFPGQIGHFTAKKP